MSTADPAAPVSAGEASSLFADLAQAPVLVLAVSGGPDSTALLVLAARWRAALGRGPELLAITVDHGLRPDSAREARAVKRLADHLGVRHRILRWSGRKPATGLQQAARANRYRLLAAAARRAGARHVLTGHTLDDQAETVLLRLARGSGITGLTGMARSTRLHVKENRNGEMRMRTPLALAGEGCGGAYDLDSVAPTPSSRPASSLDLPGRGRGQQRRGDTHLVLVRPLLEIPKARLVATLAAAGISFAEDPSNADPRFTRARLRALMPILAGEGLDAARLARLAARLRRAEASIDLAVDVAASALSLSPWSGNDTIILDAESFRRLPDEVALRLLGRAISRVGDEGPVQLGKLEALHAALVREQSALPISAPARIRRTLAGAVITSAADRLTIERAPPRRAKAHRRRRGSDKRLRRTLTTRQYGPRKAAKRR